MLLPVSKLLHFSCINRPILNAVAMHPTPTDPKPSAESTPQVPAAAGKSSPWLFWLIIVAVCGGVVGVSIGTHFSLRKKHQDVSPIAKYHLIEGDLTVTERSGKEVSLSELNGKVRVIANIYTICPHGCAAVIGEMMKLEKKFRDRSDFAQVSISVVPERDTIETLDAFSKAIGLNGSSAWWFLTGEQKKLWAYMTDVLKLDRAVPIPEDERLHPMDIYSHDLRVVLVDRKGYIRGYYSVFHPELEVARVMSETLQSDAERLINDPNL